MPPLDKPIWMRRYAERYTQLQPRASRGLLGEIAETFWYYQRHRAPEEVADERAAGRLHACGRQEAWVLACAAAIRALDPQLGQEDTNALAETLWEEDWARSVDPYLMAQALWDQAMVLAMQEGSADQPPNLLSVFRTLGD